MSESVFFPLRRNRGAGWVDDSASERKLVNNSLIVLGVTAAQPAGSYEFAIGNNAQQLGSVEKVRLAARNWCG